MTAEADILKKLLADLTAAKRGDNAIDCRLAVALFRPDDTITAARLNSAGTKVIYTLQSGKESTGVPCDLSTRVDDALGLMNEVLPGWTYSVDASAPKLGIDVDLYRPGLTGCQATGSADTLALAICAAVVAAAIPEAGQ